ncbi:MAG TPA: hypothetical protein VGI39_27375 [Polyangiaceae bacterium]|jgi:tetratricopeptide (TPR) repeat protein
MSSRSSSRFLSAALAAVLLVEVAPVRTAWADDANNVQTVEGLTNLAYEQVAAGKYADAVATYMKSYEISHAGAILYNIATIYDRKLHEHALSMEYYRRYLQATDAEPDFARKATERLSQLKAEAAAEEKMRNSVHVAPQVTTAPANLPPQPPAEQPAKSSALGPVGIVVGVVGLAGIGAALGLGALAKSKNDDANQHCTATVCNDSTGMSSEHDAGTFATASTVTFVAGAALLVTGVTLFLIAPHGRKSDAAWTSPSLSVTPRVGAGGGGVTLQATF